MRCEWCSHYRWFLVEGGYMCRFERRGDNVIRECKRFNPICEPCPYLRKAEEELNAR